MSHARYTGAGRAWKGFAMDIKHGDYVVHPTFGVGFVESIEEKEIGDNGMCAFYRIGFVKMTVWVPVLNPKYSGLRPLTPHNDLHRYCSVLKSPPSALDDDFRTRQIALESRLEQHTFQALCEVVRDLSARSWLRSLSSFESSLLKKTRGFLNQEWAATSGKSLEEASSEVESCLMEGRKMLANARKG